MLQNSKSDPVMTMPKRATFALAVCVAATFAWFACSSAESAHQDPGELRAFAFAPGYVGSDACASCHEDAYRAWKGSLHSRMEQQASPQTVRGNFTTEGVVVNAEVPGRRIVMKRSGDRFLVEAPDSDGRQQTFVVDRTVGNRYKQRYLTKRPDGSWAALPIQWLEKDHKFVEWMKKASTEPGKGDFWLDAPWGWQVKCAGCHTTGLDLGFDATTKTWNTQWRELAIGCESCHGPGLVHATAKGGKDNILCPSRMSRDQQLDTCGRCHSRGTATPEQGSPAGLPGKIAYPYDMLPGDPLDAHFTQVTLEKNPVEFHKDGASFNHHQQLTDYRKSGMFLHGGEKAPHCTTCHDPHRADALKQPVENNALCISCHEDLAGAAELTKHTGHGGDPIANPGARCVECHMPRIVNHAGSEKLRSHTFWSPNPRKARDTDTPDTCVLCHEDRDRAWAIETAAKIWPPK